ncbi:MAG: methionine--tRNA ligase, partial [Gemmatimonadales bacterium]
RQQAIRPAPVNANGGADASARAAEARRPVPKFYLTTAIDYSNGDPHLGHALEKVGADCIARWRRLRGDDVRFVMGMDEHSQSVLQAAAQAGVTPQAWVDGMAARFADFWRRLSCSHDDWIRTTEPRHARAVTALLERIQARRAEDLFMAEYEGLYCTGCEEFKQESQIVDGHCIEHPSLDLVPTKEENHFFRLSAYRDRLLDLITSGALIVDPAIRRHEVVRLLEGGLQDISISRQRQQWGIPYPGDPHQTVYVWFDALINYLSATGFPDAGFDRLWPAELHVIGKGITRFHCLIWPAMLLAAGVELPRRVWAHGYVQWGGAKMSKTAGTAVSLEGAITRYGPDALRYYLLREIGFEQDGNFTWERFDTRYIADLADTLGNLASRALSMVQRYRAGTVPRDPSGYATPLEADARGILAAYARAMDALAVERGAAELIALATRANRYVEETAPWKLAKAAREAELDTVLANLVRTVGRLAVLALPFMPAKARLLWEATGDDRPFIDIRFSDVEGLDPSGWTVRKPAALFPKPSPDE